uniref:10 kDa heat shock protein n=1 Tax=Sphaerodactylus townsendi TaxID=933632 RepID=A0ACB8G007_9SAUR
MAAQAFKKFLPLFDRVLVERCAAETVTKGGIMLPEKSQGKVLQATVVAVGSGSKTKKHSTVVCDTPTGACAHVVMCDMGPPAVAQSKNGDLQPVSVKVGEKVLLPEYGGTKVMLDDKDYFIFRDGDILGKYLD